MGNNAARVLSIGHGAVSVSQGSGKDCIANAPRSQFSNLVLQIWQATKERKPVRINDLRVGTEARAQSGYEWWTTKNREVTQRLHAIIFIESRMLIPHVRQTEAIRLGLCVTRPAAWAPRGRPRSLRNDRWRYRDRLGRAVSEGVRRNVVGKPETRPARHSRTHKTGEVVDDETKVIKDGRTGRTQMAASQWLLGAKARS